MVRAAQGGQAWAQEALFKKYAGMVSGLAFRLLGRDEGVDDCIQEVFARALMSLHRLEVPETFQAWLAAIVVRTAGHTLRRKRLLRRLGIGHGDETDVEALIAPTAPPDAAAELRSIYRVVESMPPKLRIPLLLRRVEGQTLEEIARLTETSLSTAKRRLAQAEGRLERFLTRPERGNS